MISSSETEVLDRPVAPPTRRDRVVAAVRAGFAEVTGPRRGVVPVESGALRPVLAIWALGRLLSLGILFLFYGMSRAGTWGFGPDGIPVQSFLQFLSGWDADRYGTIATEGYPRWIPMDVSGAVVPNNWAFLPVFPALEHIVVQATGMPWQLAGVLLSIAASGGATVVLYLLLRRVTTPKQSWWATVFFTFGPLSFVFVLAYAESLYLLLLFAALLLALTRRYLLILPVGIVLAFTRPGALALALGLGILFLVRWARRRSDPFRIREIVSLFVSGVSIAVAGLSWPLVADAVTGTDHAYVRTETSWWIPYIGKGDFVALTPWFRFATTYMGLFGSLLVLALMGLFLWWISSRQVLRLGTEVAGFGLSYGLYLFAVFLPQQSVFRLLMPLSPLLADERLSSTRRRRQWMLGGCIVLQAAAAMFLWTVGYP